MVSSELTGAVLKQAFKVHTALGPGLLESAYKECLAFNLLNEGFLVEKEKSIPLIYETVKLDTGYRADLIINNQLLLEIKSCEGLNDLHFAQTLTYLKVGNYQLGLLINFNVFSLKDGIRRIINSL